MRITKQQADENGTRVVETAARLFREKGFDGVERRRPDASRRHDAWRLLQSFRLEGGTRSGGLRACIRKSVAAMEAIAAIAEAAERARRSTTTGVDMSQSGARLRRRPPVRWSPSPATSRASRRRPRGICRGLPALSRRVRGARRGDQDGEAAQARPAARRSRQLAVLAGARTLARSVAEADPALSKKYLEAVARRCGDA